MRLEVCILTAPRPVPTFYRTLHSLRSAGFDMPFVYDGSPRNPEQELHYQQNGRAYLTILNRSLTYDFDMLLMVDDDVVACKNVHEYLQRIIYPEIEHSVYSLYSSSSYSTNHPIKQAKAWHPEDKGYLLSGGIAFLYPRRVVKTIADNLLLTDIKWGWDRTLGTWAQTHQHQIWCHEPSLFQHTGMSNSTLNNGSTPFGNDLGLASTFPGEDFEL